MIHMDLQQWSNVRTSFVCFIFLLGFLVLVLYSSVLCLLLLKVIFVIRVCARNTTKWFGPQCQYCRQRRLISIMFKC